MVAIALVGSDGSGKSSVAHDLVAAAGGRARYLYMGMNPDSSNIALPTTKLMFALKKRRAEVSEGEAVSMHSLPGRRVRRGKLLSAARLLNRLAEEWVRQLVSWFHQAANRVVIYDRHFLFDYWSVPTSAKRRQLSDRMHKWFLKSVYPKPDLVIFMDAPAEVLLSRKQEVPADYLEARRAPIRDAGRLVRRFEVVDASQPYERVFQDVVDLVEEVVPGLIDRGGRQGGSE